MEFLNWLLEFRTPQMNWFFLHLTSFGEETLVIITFLILYWCFSKKAGAIIFYNLILGLNLNQVLKLYFSIPRPWVRDTSFQPVAEAIKNAGGFSFPSGHTAISVALYGNLAKITKHKWLKLICILLLVLVPFSRMYLGVHTPYDVGISFIIGILLAYVVSLLIEKVEQSQKYYWMMHIVIFFLMLIGYFLLLQKVTVGDNLHLKEVVNGLENYAKICGLAFAWSISYWYDLYIRSFEVKAVWWVQICKAIIGLCLVLILKNGLEKSFVLLFANRQIALFVCYFIIGIIACLLYPLSFQLVKMTFLHKEQI